MAGGEHIAGKQRLPVGNAIRNDGQTLIGIRYADVLRLTTVNPAASAQPPLGSVQLLTKPC